MQNSNPHLNPQPWSSLPIHGDECTGIGVIHKIMENINSILHHGTLVLYPSLNPDGLRSTMRHYPEGKADLNRCFPGKKQGYPAEQHLYHIWNDIVQRKPTALIDLHTDSGSAVLIHRWIEYSIMIQNYKRKPGFCKDL